MTTILEAVGNYLQANSIGTVGTDIFLSKMPTSPSVCIGVYEGEGGNPDFTMGSNGTWMDNPSIQIIVRAGREDYPTARDKAQSIRLLLGAVNNATLSGINVLRIVPRGSLIPMGDDENNRPHVGVNFQCQLML